jgi:hypothetical protein
LSYPSHWDVEEEDDEDMSTILFYNSRTGTELSLSTILFLYHNAPSPKILADNFDWHDIDPQYIQNVSRTDTYVGGGASKSLPAYKIQYIISDPAYLPINAEIFATTRNAAFHFHVEMHSVDYTSDLQFLNHTLASFRVNSVQPC